MADLTQDNYFTRRRVIVMRHRGNLANKMIQYMGALTISKRIANCTIVNVSIPEWGLEIPDDIPLSVLSGGNGYAPLRKRRRTSIPCGQVQTAGRPETDSSNGYGRYTLLAATRRWQADLAEPAS